MNYLKFQHYCSLRCTYCLALGCLSPKTLEPDEFEGELTKLAMADNEILLPCNAFLSPRLEQIIADSLSRDLDLVLQVHCRTPLEAIRNIMEIPGTHRLRIHFLFDSLPADLFEKIALIQQHFSFVDYTLLVTRLIDVPAILENVPAGILAKIRLHVFRKQKPQDAHLSSDEVYFFLLELQEKYPSIKFNPSLLAQTQDASLQPILANADFIRQYQSDPAGQGKYIWIRRGIALLFTQRWLFPLRWLMNIFAAVSWLIVDPKRSHSFIYWRLYGIWCAFTGLVKFTCAMSYAYAYRIAGWTWILLGRAWLYLGVLWRYFGVLWRYLGVLWFYVGRLWFYIGKIWFYIGVLWFYLGIVWRYISYVYAWIVRGLGFIWFHLGRFWFYLGLLWAAWVRFYWTIRRGLGFCNRKRIEYFWRFWEWIYPLRKIYYFSEYQIRRWIFR